MREPKAKFLFLTTLHPWSQQSQRFVHSSHSLAGPSEGFIFCSYDQSSHLARRVTYSLRQAYCSVPNPLHKSRYTSSIYSVFLSH